MKGCVLTLLKDIALEQECKRVAPGTYQHKLYKRIINEIEAVEGQPWEQVKRDKERELFEMWTATKKMQTILIDVEDLKTLAQNPEGSVAMENAHADDELMKRQKAILEKIQEDYFD